MARPKTPVLGTHAGTRGRAATLERCASEFVPPPGDPRPRPGPRTRTLNDRKPSHLAVTAARIAPNLVLGALGPELGGLASGTADEVCENMADRGIEVTRDS